MDISMYPMTLNAEKLRKETGFQFKHTAYEAFQRFSMLPGGEEVNILPLFYIE
ncbi:MAG: hypothetical protein WAL97_10905 [Halobacteriota archaeon]